VRPAEARLVPPEVELLLVGDVMIGRGVDQILGSSVDPRLHEPWVRSAEQYVELAVAASGPIPRGVQADYVWGEATEVIARRAPSIRLANLETAVTTSDAAWPDKDVLYRTHPDNVDVLRSFQIDCCTLANNHVLDWGERGLVETLDRLHASGIQTVGAGRDEAEARATTILEWSGGRVLVIGLGLTSSGIPHAWAAGPDGPGVNLVTNPESAVRAVASEVGLRKQPGDVVVASIHWGANWGYEIEPATRRLAHALIDQAGVDLIHGHSSHHPRPIELDDGHLILHGCGDFITDYEGIAGHERYRDDLVVAYLARIERASGRLSALTLLPFQLRRFRLVRPSRADVAWLATTLDRHSRGLGCRVAPAADGSLVVTPA
jgi:poly-gamma-glutamate capsule biosynthesis protein CapA/YwtB (metallophosphatase superfamily)